VHPAQEDTEGVTPPDAPTTDGFVGRVGELDQLGLALASARAGHGRAVLVIGDAGVGKTRLAQQAAIVASDFLVLTGACLPLSSLSVPLLPLRTALSAVTGERTLPVLRGASSSVAEEFDRWLEERCREQPVLLLVDDLQWADPATLDVLMWVVAGLAHRGLAVVATVRRGDVGPGHPMMRWLADVRRLPGFDEITLGLLDLEETRQQVGTLVGGVPHDTLVREVFERTGGNAYLNRLLVAGVPANATRLGDHALPEDLSTAVLRRWNDLSRDARELTLVAAVGARALRGDALDQAAAVAGVGDPAPLLRECVAAEVLDPQPLDGYWFHHPLQAEALESSLPEPERRRLHAAFAALLEAASAQTGPELSTAILVADHHYRAGDPEAAFTWAISAADHAEAAGADAEAVRLLHRAIGVHHFLAHPGVAVMDLRLRLREAAVRSGELEEELAVVEALLDDAERLGALLTSELVVRRQHLRFVTGAGFLELAEMERAVDLASGAPTSWQYAYALAECAHAALWADDPRAPDLADRALVQARAGHHPRALSHAFAASAMAADFDGRNDEALLLAREGVQAASMARDAFAFVHASLWEANAQASPADERYFETLHSRRVQLTSLGAPHPFLAWLAVVEAQSRLTCGHWEACRQLLREALGSTPGALVDVLGRLNAAELAARQGRPEEAKGHLARADELFAETSTFLAFQFDACRALVRLSAGDPRGCVTAALTGTETPGVPPTKCEWLLPLAARGLAELAQNSRDAGGDVQALIDEADDLERRFPHVIRDSGSTSEYDAILEGLDALYQAELARVRDAERLGPAWRWVAERLHGRLPWEECYALWRAAESFLKEGPPQRARAVDALRDAHALAQRLVATPDLEQVEAIARGARVSLQVPVTQPFVAKSTTPRSTVALTARESEVLAHVVAGRTYGEIARALVLSQKTVSSHISHLLTKTGTRNRVDLARWAARRQASEEEARGPAS
jgi:DNA-binding CsgD family transcriptional regulator